MGRRDKTHKRCQLLVLSCKVFQGLPKGSPQESDLSLEQGDLISQRAQALVHASDDLDGLRGRQAVELHIGQDPVSRIASTKVDDPVVDAGMVADREEELPVTDGQVQPFCVVQGGVPRHPLGFRVPRTPVRGIRTSAKTYAWGAHSC